MRKKNSLHHVPNVLAIGAGEIGRAIAHLLEQRGLKMEMWDRDPTCVPCQRPLAASVPEADVIFLCVPSWALRSVNKNLIACGLQPNTVLVALSKGLEEKTLLGVNEILDQSLPNDQRYCLLAGPMLAEEIIQNLSAAAVVAARSARTRGIIVDLFRDTDLRIETSSDIHGIAMASVVKNIYAISLGIADGLGWGGNRKGWLADRAASEMRQVLAALKANPMTVYTAAGLADLISTGFSHYSKNHQVGDEIVHTGGIKVKSEGVVALPSLVRKLGPKIKRFPLLNCLVAVVMRGRRPNEIFERYFHEAK